MSSKKFRIEITVCYAHEMNSRSVCSVLRDRTLAALSSRHPLLMVADTFIVDSGVEVQPFRNIAYVVMRDGKPLASYSDERLAQDVVDHDEHPERCSIEEVESA